MQAVCVIACWVGFGRFGECWYVPIIPFKAFALKFHDQLGVGQRANADIISLSLGIRIHPQAWQAPPLNQSWQSLNERIWGIDDRNSERWPVYFIKETISRRTHISFRNLCLMVSVDVEKNICLVCFPCYQDGDSSLHWFLSVLQGWAPEWARFL